MVANYYPKWVMAVPIRNKKSSTICQALKDRGFPVIPCVPFRILTDNSPEFISQDFTELLAQYYVVYVKTTPYKTSISGTVERVNRTLGKFLTVISQQQPFPQHRNWLYSS
ncbi:uncharacterized protein [Palaemon carinicauda]|uniref:uncharacterized protein n=1 Tax=Palaemon carinicauda TaxID=392227 RepID=UPI0035B5A944